MRALAVTAGICAVLAMAGCSKSTQEGTATPASQTKLSRDQLWDSCTLADSVVAATGVDPSTKNTNPGDAQFPDWRGCSWRTTGYFLTVGATAHTMADVHASSSFKDMKDVSIPGRQAVSYNDGSSDNCYVDFATAKGVADIAVRKAYGTATSEDPCAIAVRSATVLNSSIPK